MKNIHIEWKHFDKGGNTCVRCANTGTALLKAINELNSELKDKHLNISYEETRLTEDEIDISNTILINGIKLEELMENTYATETTCTSCCEMIGSTVNCKALDCNGKITEDIPVELITSAVKNLLRKEEV